MKQNIVVATHHKTGTVWMATVFKAIARRLGAHYVDFWTHFGRLDRALKPPFILLNHNSIFSRHASTLRRDDVRILHLIRDPRDVLISAMHYHKKASEPWLHETISGGKEASYQQRLNALATVHEQYVFELENATGSTIEAMLDWQYDRPNCLEIRYEDLWGDRSLSLWREVGSFLGFEGPELEVCEKCFWEHSLFGKPSRANLRHSRSGEAQQWTREFTPELAEAFVDRFPDALQTLGYEEDDRWIESLNGSSKARETACPAT